MPRTDVWIYAESDGSSPVIDWLDSISDNPRDKLNYRIQRLEQRGYELRRPEAAPLRDGIYELRVVSQRVNYRLLYFFHDRHAVIAHGCTKQAAVDEADINRALERKMRYERSPEEHRFGGE